MTSFRDFSISRKVIAIIMIISGASLLFASISLIAYDFVVTRRDLRASAVVFARIVADNTMAAVRFDDRAAAEETLNSLRAEPSIIAACIYTPAGLFAQHVNSGEMPCSERFQDEQERSDYIAVSAPIALNGNDIGTVHLHASLETAYSHLRLEIATIFASLLLAGLLAFALSSRLHRIVSAPILNLAQTAQEVSRRKDYSLRATKQSEDELGTLVDAFNEMLAQIQKRETALQERTAELTQANRMKDEFLATLSHELRTPLNSILGWAVLMHGGQLTRDRELSAVQAIERNARVQARLIEDLLDVSRIISGKFTLDSSEVLLRQIVETAIDVIRPAAEAKQIRIEYERPADSPRVIGDAARLQQVVWNLLSNAVKFSGDQGAVGIRLDKDERSARVSVLDNGAGIAPEFLPYVFDRFRQADGSSTRAHGGLGLGLAIVRHIVEMHGGSVRVESRGLGHGSTFTIELPLMVQQPRGESFRLGPVR